MMEVKGMSNKFGWIKCKDCRTLNRLLEEIGLTEKFPHTRVFCCNECLWREVSSTNKERK